MNNEIINIKLWGRELPIEIKYDCFEDEAITVFQKETLSRFLEDKDSLMDNAYKMLVMYCLKEYPEDYPLVCEDVFKCVTPKALYIKRSITKKSVIGLLCEFKSDKEHGLAFYIEDNKLVKVGPQDIIL